MKTEKGFFQNLQKAWLGESSEPFSDKVLELAYEPLHVGSMVKMDAVGRVCDECGDVFEIFLRVRDGRIIDASFLSEGCGPIMAVGSALCALAIGKTVHAAAGISCTEIIQFLDGLPSSHRHCAGLAIRAIRSARNSFEVPSSKTG